MKHTPGPWKWELHDVSIASLEGPGGEVDNVFSVSPCSCCTKSALGEGWKWGRCTTPKEDDARLIAAAPELLAALKSAVARLDAHEGTEDNADLRAVIAKAEGKI